MIFTIIPKYIKEEIDFLVFKISWMNISTNFYINHIQPETAASNKFFIDWVAVYKYVYPYTFFMYRQA